jgi:hypothetical protein
MGADFEIAEKLARMGICDRFVSGHDFSRAVTAAKMNVGFSPCCKLFGDPARIMTHFTP